MSASQPRVLTRQESVTRLLDRRPDLSMDRTQRRRAREIAASLGNQAGVIEVLAAWLAVNADSDLRDLASALGDRLQLRLASLAPRQRTDELTLSARVDEGFGLGWERIDQEVVREVLRLLVLAGPDGAPADVLTGAAEGTSADLTQAADLGFVTVDGSGTVRADPGTLAFVSTRGANPLTRSLRRLRLALAVRDHAARILPADTALDTAAERAAAYLDELGQHGLRASLAHRMAELLRLRGDLAGARQWVELGLAVVQHHPEAMPLAGLLALDEAALVLFEHGASVARTHAVRAVALLEAARAAGEPGADAAHSRAELLLLQIDAATRSAAPEEAIVALIDRLFEQASRPGATRDARAATCIARQTLGSAMLRRGQRTEARELLGQARRAMEQIAVDDGRATALLVAEAQGLHPAIDPRPGFELLDRARVLGGGDMDREADRSLPLALHELALAAGDRGDRASAATLLDEAAMLANSLLPEADPVRATAAYSRALLFLADGEHRRAERELERAAVGWTRAYPSAHPVHAVARAAIAWAGARSGELAVADAEAALEEAGTALADTPGLDQSWLAQIHALHADLAAGIA